MERPAAALLLVALVALAGCTGVTDQTTTATTAEPTTPPTTDVDAASTTTDAPTTTGTPLDPASADLPPGVTAAGVENASQLLAAHRDALAASGFRFRLEANTSFGAGEVSHRTGNGTVSEGLAPLRLQSRTRRSADGQTLQRETDTWANESVALTRYHTDARTRYAQRSVVNGTTGTDATSARTVSLARLATQSHIVQLALRAGEYEVAGVEIRDGTTLTTLRATAVSGQSSVENVSEYESTLVVDERGRVHRLDMTLLGDSTHLRYDFELTYFGDVTVEYPSWTERALATVNAHVTVDSADGYFVVANEGGETLPPGSEVQVAHAGVNAALELDDPLAAGEKVYVRFPDDGQPVLTEEPPADDETTELSGQYEFEVVDPTGKGLMNAAFGFGSASAPVNTTTTGDE